MFESRRVGLHQLDRGTQRIGHIHHIHIYVVRYGAGKTARAHGLVIYLDSIVGGSAAGQRHIGDDARKTHRTRIDAETRVIIVGEQLARYLAYAIYSIGLHDSILRSVVAREIAAERTDRAGREERAFLLAGYLQRVLQSTHVDTHRQLRILLAGSRQQRDEVVDSIDTILVHQLGVTRTVKGIESFERTLGAERFARFDIGSEDVRRTVNFSQIWHQLRSDLTSGAQNQYAFHKFR